MTSILMRSYLVTFKLVQPPNMKRFPTPGLGHLAKQMMMVMMMSKPHRVQTFQQPLLVFLLEHKKLSCTYLLSICTFYICLCSKTGRSNYFIHQIKAAKTAHRNTTKYIKAIKKTCYVGQQLIWVFITFFTALIKCALYFITLHNENECGFHTENQLPCSIISLANSFPANPSNKLTQTGLSHKAALWRLIRFIGWEL